MKRLLCLKFIITAVCLSVMMTTGLPVFAQEQTDGADIEETVSAELPANMLVYALDTTYACINGGIVNTYTTPYMYDGMSMVPVERIVEYLGGACSYDSESRILTLALNGNTVEISVDDEDCAVFDTMFYPIRKIADDLGINMCWYDGIITFSVGEPWIYGETVDILKHELGYTCYTDVLLKNRIPPQNFIYPYEPYTYEWLNNDLHTLRNMYPDLFSKVYSIGKSTEGRDILAINFGKGEKKVVLCGAMHAREYISTSFIMYMLDRYAYSCYMNEIWDDRFDIGYILDNVTFIVVPQINPDGVNLVQFGVESTKNPEEIKKIPFTSDGGKYGYRSWKSNINGVNLNANFPVFWAKHHDSPNSTSYGGSYECSEAETQAMVNLIDNNDFKVFASFHSQGEVIYWMDGLCDRNLKELFSPYIDRLCAETGYAKMPPDHNNSVGCAMTDYVRYYKKAMAITVELCPYTGPYPFPDSRFDEALYPVRNLIPLLGETAMELYS